MAEFNSYMVSAMVESKVEGQYQQDRVPMFFLRDDVSRDAPTTAQEACAQALRILSAMVTSTSGITSITVAVGSLDQREDSYRLKKHFPSGRICAP